MKRIFDIFFAVIMIIVTLPICLVSAFGIMLSSRGPIIYKAKRVGQYGLPFTLYKFRTMRVDSGEIKLTTLKDDDRIFAFGRFLRKSKIDELPQLVNILFNQMSVVGPRPEDLIIAKSTLVGNFKKILEVKPGLTSPASLFDFTHGEQFDSHIEYEQKFLPIKLKLELYYVENHNFCYDLEIVVRTGSIILARLFGKKQFGYPKEYYAAITNNETEFF